MKIVYGNSSFRTTDLDRGFETQPFDYVFIYSEKRVHEDVVKTAKERHNRLYLVSSGSCTPMTEEAKTYLSCALDILNQNNWFCHNSDIKLPYNHPRR